MDEKRGNRLVHPNLKIDLLGNPSIVDGKVNNAVRLNGDSQYLDAGETGDTCLGDLSRCPHGFTMSTWVKFDKLQEDSYYMSTGNKGVSMFYKNGMLHVAFNQPGKLWQTSVRGVQPNQWYFVEATWHPQKEAKLYVDNRLVSWTTAQRVAPKPDKDDNHFYIGRANNGDTPNDYFKYPDVTLDEMEIWYSNRDDLLAFDYIQRGKARKYMFLLCLL